MPASKVPVPLIVFTILGWLIVGIFLVGMFLGGKQPISFAVTLGSTESSLAESVDVSLAPSRSQAQAQPAPVASSINNESQTPEVIRLPPIRVTATPLPTTPFKGEAEPTTPASGPTAISPVMVTSTTQPLPTTLPTSTPPPKSRIPQSELPPHQRYAKEKGYMLDLINRERQKAGAPPVTMGTNDAAQIQAESTLKNCTDGHWGPDGLKSHMRYSLAGGYQDNGENAIGLSYCLSLLDKLVYAPLEKTEEEIAKAMEEWLASPGHLKTLLDPFWRKVNIGLAWDSYNTTMYQQFEGNYVEFTEGPTLEDGVLWLAGTTRNGVTFLDDDTLDVQIYYDPPPHPLTQGQLARTYCVDLGTQVASLRKPLPASWSYNEDHLTKDNERCPDPYSFPVDIAPPDSPGQARELWLIAKNAGVKDVQVSFPLITAEAFHAGKESFVVRAMLGDLLAEHGPGVYTFLLWGLDQGSEKRTFSRFSLFHEVEPPDIYGRWNR